MSIKTVQTDITSDFASESEGRESELSYNEDYYLSPFQKYALEIIGNPTTIGTYSFHKLNGLIKVYIPDSVTTIKDGAFQNCKNLQTVRLPESLLHIGRRSFQGCESLEHISFPWSGYQQTIGYGAFMDTNLKKVSFTSVNVRFGNQVFKGCKNLVEVSLPSHFYDLSNHSNLPTLPSEMFKDCIALKEVNGLHLATQIGDSAFSGCTSLSDVIFSPDLLSIGSFAFKETNLRTVSFGGERCMIWFGAFQQCEELTTVFFDQNSNIGFYGIIFHNCTKLTHITLPRRFQACTVEGLKIMQGISNYMFHNCKNLKTVKNFEVVERIEEGAFCSCTSFKPEFSENLKEISMCAFSSCKFKSLSLPQSLKTIDEKAFYGCSELASVTLFTPTIETIDKKAFSACPKLTRIYTLTDPKYKGTREDQLFRFTYEWENSHREKIFETEENDVIFNFIDVNNLNIMGRRLLQEERTRNVLIDSGASFNDRYIFAIFIGLDELGNHEGIGLSKLPRIQQKTLEFVYRPEKTENPLLEQSKRRFENENANDTMRTLYGPVPNDYYNDDAYHEVPVIQKRKRKQSRALFSNPYLVSKALDTPQNLEYFVAFVVMQSQKPLEFARKRWEALDLKIKDHFVSYGDYYAAICNYITDNEMSDPNEIHPDLEDVLKKMIDKTYAEREDFEFNNNSRNLRLAIQASSYVDNSGDSDDSNDDDIPLPIKKRFLKGRK